MAEKPSTPKIRVGPAGWSYKDWIGIAYPKRKPPHFQEATVLANYIELYRVLEQITSSRSVSHSLFWWETFST
jgi:hypothetical protein